MPCAKQGACESGAVEMVRVKEKDEDEGDMGKEGERKGRVERRDGGGHGQFVG